MRRVVIVLLALLVVPAAAHASAVVNTRASARVTSLSLRADGQPVWAERARDGSVTAVTTAGDTLRVLARDRPRSDGEDLVATVLAAGDTAAVAVGHYTCDDCHQTPSLEGTNVFAGPATAPLPALDVVQQPEWTLQLGDGLVGLAPLVADLRTGARRDFPAAQAGFLLLGGGLMARREPGPGQAFVVSEAATGRELYRLTDPDARAFALAADGTLLIGQGRGPLTIATPADPTPRPLPFATLDAQGYVAPGRIGLRRGRTFTAYDLAGTRVANVDVGDTEVPVAYDGTRIAWVSGRCGVSFVRVWTLGEPAPRIPAGRCTLPSVRIGGMTRDGVAVTLRCAQDSPLGCRAAIAAEVRRVAPGRRGGWQDLEVDEVEIGPGERVTDRLGLPLDDLARGTYEVRVTRENRRLRTRRLRVR